MCGAAGPIRVASANLHFGEEPHFVGQGGSGTIFLSCCNLGCVFCQNHDISHGRAGIDLSADALAGIMLELQQAGAENINLVTPSHYPAGILEAIGIAKGRGLTLPLVYNTSGYDSVGTLRFFDGVIDVYMPDFKFASDELGAQLTAVSDYSTIARDALREMVRQAGPGLQLVKGIAVRGISVRHLVLPGHYDDSRACLDFLRSLSPRITVNLMRQYRPAYGAFRIPGMNRTVDYANYAELLDYGRGIGLTNLLDQA